MVFDYEADCSYNTKMLLLPHTSNCTECSRNFGRQAVREGLCAAITFPFSSSARIGIISPLSFQSGSLSALPCPASLSRLSAPSTFTPQHKHSSFSLWWIVMPSHHAFHNNSVDSESGVLVRGRPMPNMRGKEEITASVPIVSGKKTSYCLCFAMRTWSFQRKLGSWVWLWAAHVRLVYSQLSLGIIETQLPFL